MSAIAELHEGRVVEGVYRKYPGTFTSSLWLRPSRRSAAAPRWRTWIARGDGAAGGEGAVTVTPAWIRGLEQASLEPARVLGWGYVHFEHVVALETSLKAVERVIAIGPAW